MVVLVIPLPENLVRIVGTGHPAFPGFLKMMIFRGGMAFCFTKVSSLLSLSDNKGKK
jgi:hypothetical protein